METISEKNTETIALHNSGKWSFQKAFSVFMNRKRSSSSTSISSLSSTLSSSTYCSSSSPSNSFVPPTDDDNYMNNNNVHEIIPILKNRALTTTATTTPQNTKRKVTISKKKQIFPTWAPEEYDRAGYPCYDGLPNVTGLYIGHSYTRSTTISNNNNSNTTHHHNKNEHHLGHSIRPCRGLRYFELTRKANSPISNGVCSTTNTSETTAFVDVPSYHHHLSSCCHHVQMTTTTTSSQKNCSSHSVTVIDETFDK